MAIADGRRVALVIGNSAYKHSAELRNPRNDAQDVAAALQHLDFTVISGFDLDHSGMRRTISRFAAALEDATVGVFYYAGHGIQLNGTNYLVPTDSKLENQYSPQFELIRVDLVQSVMENKKRTNILFLDACRDNPLARNLARAMGTRSTSLPLGLSSTESGIGTLVSFSTQPGNVAEDGQGRNSPYAAALAMQLKLPGVSLSEMLINVRRDVMQATNDRQIPWEHSALRDRFYFAAPKPVVVAPPPPAPKADEDREPIELTPAQKSRLSSRLNRELKRVGCDPRATGGTWTATSQAALQRFAEITKLALFTDEPTRAALDAVASHKFIVCSRVPVATPRLPDKPLQSPIAATPPPIIEPPPAATPPAAAPAPESASLPALPAPPKAATLPPAALPPASVTPPAAAVVPVVTPPPVAAIPPAAATPPATLKLPKAAPRAVPRTAAVKPPRPAPPATSAAPFTTKVRREKKCRLETWEECARRMGAPGGIVSICPPAARKETCS